MTGPFLYTWRCPQVVQTACKVESCFAGYRLSNLEGQQLEARLKVADPIPSVNMLYVAGQQPA